MQDPSQDLGEVFFALCKSVDTPKSLAAWLCFKYKSSDLFSLAADPRHYDTATAYAADYLVTSYLSKMEGKWPGVDPRAKAIQRFATAEDQCRLTNETIRAYRAGRFSYLPAVERVLLRAQRKIARLLGDFDPRMALEGCRWGPGATASLPARRATRDLKHSEVPIKVTRGGSRWLKTIIESDPHWFTALTGVEVGGPYTVLRSMFQYVETNAVIYVPKNARTDRSIAKEPTGNSFLQQGLGQLLRRLLRTVGVDLDNQSRNQELARKAMCELLATIDLSMASDTVAKELVFLLLPLRWALYADSLRARSYRSDSGPVVYEKFSSMGNAFTFELESLIFWGLTAAVREEIGAQGSIAVYGDDIILPQECAPLMAQVLTACGFTLNREKSFMSGRFFESCGKHYFDGVDVTPVYQKKPLNCLPEFFRAGNRLRRWAFVSGLGVCLDPLTSSAYQAVRRVARSYRSDADSFYLPFRDDGADDGWHLFASEWPGNRYLGRRGALHCRLLRPRTRVKEGKQTAMLALQLRLASGRRWNLGDTPAVAHGKKLPGLWPATFEDLHLSLGSECGEGFGGLVTPRQEPFYVVRNTWVTPTRDFDTLV